MEEEDPDKEFKDDSGSEGGAKRKPKGRGRGRGRGKGRGREDSKVAAKQAAISSAPTKKGQLEDPVDIQHRLPDSLPSAVEVSEQYVQQDMNEAKRMKEIESDKQEESEPKKKMLQNENVHLSAKPIQLPEKERMQKRLMPQRRKAQHRILQHKM